MLAEQQRTRTSRWAVVAAFAGVAAATQMVWLTFAPVTTAASASLRRLGHARSAGSRSRSSCSTSCSRSPRASRSTATCAAGSRPARCSSPRARRCASRATSYALLMAGTLIAAVAQPLVVNSVTPIAAGYLDERDRPLGIALMSASLFAGMLAAFVLGALLSDSDQMQALVAIQAAVAVVAAAALVLALRTAAGPPRRARARRRSARSASPGTPRSCAGSACSCSCPTASSSRSRPGRRRC